jgi:hypothetical protein
MTLLRFPLSLVKRQALCSRTLLQYGIVAS